MSNIGKNDFMTSNSKYLVNFVIHVRFTSSVCKNETNALIAYISQGLQIMSHLRHKYHLDECINTVQDTIPQNVKYLYKKKLLLSIEKKLNH